jgi:hypothetical protein
MHAKLQAILESDEATAAEAAAPDPLLAVTGVVDRWRGPGPRDGCPLARAAITFFSIEYSARLLLCPNKWRWICHSLSLS